MFYYNSSCILKYAGYGYHQVAAAPVLKTAIAPAVTYAAAPAFTYAAAPIVAKAPLAVSFKKIHSHYIIF